MDAFELESQDKAGLRARVNNVSASDLDDRRRDAHMLARSGKKEVLKRRFGLLSMTSLAMTNTISWEFVLITFGVGLANGGPAGLIYGCIVSWVGMLSVFTCLGELASMMPTAAGQYHWVATLAPPALKAPLSYVTGWVTVLTWVIATTAGAYQAILQVQQLAAWLHPEYNPQPWQSALIMWAFVCCCFLMNTIFGALLPLAQLLFLVMHILGWFVFVIPIAALGPHGDSRELFTQFNNSGDWQTTGLAFLIGFQGMAGVFTGGDCAVHMSEEVKKADINVARAMVLSVSINGILSFTMTIVMLYFAGPLDILLATSGDVLFPYMNVVYTATGSKGATAALMSIPIFMLFAGCTSSIAAGGRMMWAFARDRGLPFWRQVRRVDRRFALPIIAMSIIAVIACLLCLIQIGSQVAFQIIVSLIVEGYYSSYLCALLPLFYHRLTGNICDPDKPDYPSAKFTWGPWRLRGWIGAANNLFAICFLGFGAFWSLWPPTRVVNAQTMNYSSLMLGSVALLSAVYYFVWARKTFTGPVVEAEEPVLEASH